MAISRPRRTGRASAGALAAVLVAALAGCDLASIQVVSGTSPVPGSAAFGADVSYDGSIVVFVSGRVYDAADTNGVHDVFVSDRNHQEIRRVSTKLDSGRAPNSSSTEPSVSGDGRYVSWTSAASDIVDGDANGVADIFRRDLVSGATVRVSVAQDGNSSNGGSSLSSMSDNGRFVAFQSTATDLAEDDTNAESDVFVRDMADLKTTRWSVGPLGQQGNGASFGADISGDGGSVVFATASTTFGTTDTNGRHDIFLTDGSGSITRVSSPPGGQSNGRSTDPVINGDGTVVAFHSTATNLDPLDTSPSYDVFVWEAGSVELVSLMESGGVGSGSSFAARIDASGNVVGFTTDAPEATGSGGSLAQSLVRVRDIERTEHASASLTGERGTNSDTIDAISGDGRTVILQASSTNLVEGDGPGIDVMAKSFPFPEVQGVVPSVLGSGTTTTVAVPGHSFVGPFTVEVESDAGAELILGPPTIMAGYITMQVTVPPGAPAQSYDVTFTSLGRFPGDSGTQTTCYGCLSVG